ncbi:MAG: cytochrome c oxidase subunit 2 [Leptospiraceae bacterium]|nr:MAG: cytochrome c oxidase subunit 2 [Leptospiraceae bacterium]
MFEWFIDSASTIAPQVNFVMNLVNFITGLAFLLTNATLVYFIIKYRRRKEGEITSRIDQNHTIEVIWTVIPSIILAILYIIGLKDFRELRAAGQKYKEILVSAKQWSWNFTYTTDSDLIGSSKKLQTDNILYLEENERVKLIMKSKDVIHSFYVPEFRVKEDVVGNIYTYVTFIPLISDRQKNMSEQERKIWYQITEDQKEIIPQVEDQCEKLKQKYGINLPNGSCASYRIYCAEYCGKDHSYMLGSAVVLKKEQFLAVMNKLKEEQGQITISAEYGRQLYETKGCKSCHSIDGTKVVGPTWKGVWGTKRKLIDGRIVTIDENYITTAILEPTKEVAEGYPNIMPPQDLNEEQIQSIIEFIKSLK